MSARRRRKKEFFKSERKARYAEDTSKVGEVREIEAGATKKVMYEKLDVVNSR